jgi:hypothetical protein
MRQLKSFAAAIADFVIGDDWHVAALVLAGLALTAVLTHVGHLNAWWALPLFALAALAWSLHRAAAPPAPPATPAPPRPSAAAATLDNSKNGDEPPFAG